MNLPKQGHFVCWKGTKGSLRNFYCPDLTIQRWTPYVNKSLFNATCLCHSSWLVMYSVLFFFSVYTRQLLKLCWATVIVKCSNTCSLFIIHFLVYFYVSAYSHVLLIAPVQCVGAYVKMLMTELWCVLWGMYRLMITLFNLFFQFSPVEVFYT